MVVSPSSRSSSSTPKGLIPLRRTSGPGTSLMTYVLRLGSSDAAGPMSEGVSGGGTEALGILREVRPSIPALELGDFLTEGDLRRLVLGSFESDGRLGGGG